MCSISYGRRIRTEVFFLPLSEEKKSTCWLSSGNSGYFREISMIFNRRPTNFVKKSSNLLECQRKKKMSETISIRRRIRQPQNILRMAYGFNTYRFSRRGRFAKAFNPTDMIGLFLSRRIVSFLFPLKLLSGRYSILFPDILLK